MQLQLQQLLPTYFSDEQSRTSEVWRRELLITKGEYIKIVAPSGSGKTSLTHFLYGLRSEYNGNILFNGSNLKAYTPEDWATYRKDHVSIVFQDLRLFPDLTVQQNLELKRQLHPAHPAEKIKEMAVRLGVAHKLSSPGRTCSYGEQQRIAIIRALMQPYDFLLLDEPFSHLDEANAKKAMELMLEESKARKASIIFADLERIDWFPFTRLFHL